MTVPAQPTMGTYGTSPKNVSGAPERGMLVPKKNTQAGDPTAPGTMNLRPQTVERLGAGYRVKAVDAPIIDPAAGFTQANGRILNPVINRSRPNFYQAMAISQNS